MATTGCCRRATDPATSWATPRPSGQRDEPGQRALPPARRAGRPRWGLAAVTAPRRSRCYGTASVGSVTTGRSVPTPRPVELRRRRPCSRSSGRRHAADDDGTRGRARRRRPLPRTRTSSTASSRPSPRRPTPGWPGSCWPWRVALATDDVDRLDLKIATAALAEMRDAFRVFAPYEDVPKVTIFGSARTRPDDPVYEQARRVAADLAAQGWMVVTGAGPGIMAAGMEGAGREQSIGVSIRLPVRAGRQLRHRRRPQVRGDEVLLHPEADAHQGVEGLHLPARWLRHARRDLRAAHADADRQGTARAHRLPRHAGRHYWRTVEALHRGGAGDPRPRQPRRRRPLPRHRRLRGGDPRDPPLLRQLPLAALRRRPARDPGAARRRTTRSWPSSTSASATCACGAGSSAASRSSVEVKERDALDLQRVRFTFARHGFAQLRGLIDALNDLPV